MVKMVAAKVNTAIIVTVLLTLTILASIFGSVQAADTSQNPQAGSVGLEGSISTEPPKRAATITTPGNGAVFAATPITIAGLCTTGNIVKIFDNNVFVGSAMCISGSYSLRVDLFGGSNQLVARVYDALDQAGPDSSTVNVTFNDAQYAQFGSRITLSSIFARRGAYPGDSLVWPLILRDGTGPYAVSVDWGDGTAPALQSQATAGDLDVKHTYTSAGVYTVVIRATDKNGVAAFLQLVAVANGAIQANAAGQKGNLSSSNSGTVVWWPMLLLAPLPLAAFWVGRRHELYQLRKSLDVARRQ
jgi:hypothetical protein